MAGASADQLHLGGQGSLRAELVANMQRMVTHAERITGLAGRRPAEAVHEWRKTMRRARAVARLCAPLLPEKERRRIAGAFARAQRVASDLRDADVLLPVLRQLRADEHTGPRERAVLGRVSRRLRGRRRGGRAGLAI